MRLSAPSTTLSLALLLEACASSQEQELQPESVADANFKLGIGYMQSGRLPEVAAEKLLKALQFDERSPRKRITRLPMLYEDMREYSPAETHYQASYRTQA
jgi:type IV pilus assembly protein PilF